MKDFDYEFDDGDVVIFEAATGIEVCLFLYGGLLFNDCHESEFDVECVLSVHRPTSQESLSNLVYFIDNNCVDEVLRMPCLWKRKEKVVEYTIGELEKKLGHKIKIVKEKSNVRTSRRSR